MSTWPPEDDTPEEPLIYCDACTKPFYESDGMYRLADMWICKPCQGDFEDGMKAIEETRK